jgi:hypothetical protein
MTEHVQHPPVRLKYQRRCIIEGCTVTISATQSTVTGERAIRIASKLNRWLEDGMLQGSAIGTFKKYPDPI